MVSFQHLETMYLNAPFQKLYPGTTIQIAAGRAEISLDINNRYHHAAQAMHGSVYFRLLDDACYFAALSADPTYFLLTKTFEINFIRPFKKGKVFATGLLMGRTLEGYRAKGELKDNRGKLLAKGEGLFLPGNHKLNALI
jgi:uncharacterized protein (TIGR00369 family)